MLTLLLLLLILYGSVCFVWFLWNFIHEMSHVIAVKLTSGLYWYRMKLYSHKIDGDDCSASVTYLPKRALEPKERAFISLAPFIPALLASILCPLFIFMSGWVAVLWFLFWSIGVIDLFSGATASGKSSDIMNAAENLKVKAWKLRTLGLAAAPTFIIIGMVIGNVLARYLV